VLSPQLVIQAVSEAYLEATLTRRDQIVGRYVFDVFPDNPRALHANAVRNLKASLEAVLSTKEPHQMPLQRYDVPNPGEPGEFVERYWSPLNTPVLDAQGAVRCIVHRVTNVTDRVKTEGLLLQSQANERAAWAEAGRQRTHLHTLFFREAPAPIVILDGPELVFELVNPAYQQIFPGRELFGKPLPEALPELDDMPIPGLLRQVYQTGESYVAREMPVRMARSEGKPPEDIYWTFTCQARRNGQGLPAVCSGVGKVQESARLIAESVERFKRTIAHLTEVSKLQKEAHQPAVSVPVANVIEKVILDLGPQIETSAARIEVAVGACPTIEFSEKNLRSIVYNLLSNAIKYRSPDRAPLVRIGCDAEPGYYVLTVADNGLGLDLTEGKREKLFAMFKRLHNHVEGSGIGLYMVRKIIDYAGGKIAVESTLGAGSTFRVYFKR